MNILHAASEAVPLAKTGGLADVTGALPRAVHALGAAAAVILPGYAEVPEELLGRFATAAEFTVRLGWRNQTCRLLKADIDGVTYYQVDNDYYYKRGSLYGYGMMRSGSSFSASLSWSPCRTWDSCLTLSIVTTGRPG